jgi:hypothetical protein
VTLQTNEIVKISTIVKTSTLDVNNSTIIETMNFLKSKHHRFGKLTCIVRKLKKLPNTTSNFFVKIKSS